MADLSIKLSKIESGRSLFKVSLRVAYPNKVGLETIIEAISETMAKLSSKTLVIPGEKKSQKK